jgi:hypothetical protein
MTADDVLFDQVGAALGTRGGWRYEPSTTPGGLPSWCLDPGGEVVVSVNVTDGAVVAYLPSHDRDVRFGGLDGLLAWLDEREGSAGPG